MAITPLSATGLVRSDQSVVPERTVPGRGTNKIASLLPVRDVVTDEHIQSARRGSLLYQVVSKLLLSEQQNRQLRDELSKIDETSRPDESRQVTPTPPDQPNQILQVDIEIITLRLEAQSNNISIEAQLDWLSFDISLQQAPEEADPLVLDLDGNGILFSDTSDGALFDINNDGRLERMSTIRGEDAFLALDRNNNGRIDNASELFGDQDGAANGFESLRRYDDNQDNLIDSRDQVFSRLLTTRLVGNSQFIEQLADQRVKSISLDYQDVATGSDAGNRVVQLSDYRTDKGTANIADVMLTYQRISESDSD